MIRRLRGPLVLALSIGVIAALTSLATAATPKPGAHLRGSEGAVDGGLASGPGRPNHFAHGDDAGRHGRGRIERGGPLASTQSNVELIGKAPVDDRSTGRVADVTVKGNFAYEASFAPDCVGGGVYVFDIANLRNPKQIGFIPTGEGVFVGEGQQVVTLHTRGFRGDVLLFQNELCGLAETSVGGATLVDVRDPRHPVVLASGFGDLDPAGSGPGIAHQVHSAFAWQAGGRAYAVLVDDEEDADVDIFEITNPRQPVKVAEYDVAARWPGILQPNAGLDTVFFHDVVVKQIHGRQVMLLSYWDAGYVLLDVTDPARARFIADTDFAAVDPELRQQTGRAERPEGNAHEAEFTKDNRYLVTTDEDFGPTGLRGSTDDGTAISGSEGSDTAPIGDGNSLAGTSVYVGRACTADPAVPAPPATGGPYLAVVERGVCGFTEKVTNIEAVTANGGYAGAVVVNREASCGAFGMTVEGARAAVAVDRRTGFSFFDIEGQYDEAACQAGDGTALMPIALGTVGDVVTAQAFFNGWGYVHLWRNGTGKLRELDTFAIPEGMDPARAQGFGNLTVHEVATSHRRADLVYSSYYAGGFRVLKIDHGKLRQVGSFLDEGGNDFWGVEVFSRGGKEYVAASDRDFGLYIFRYTGRH